MGTEEMVRTVSASICGDVADTSDLVLSVAVASGPHIAEQLQVTVGGTEMAVSEVVTHAGTRLHLAHGIPPGPLAVTYQATATGRGLASGATDAEQYEYSVPSRYADSDRLASPAATEFPNLSGGKELLDAVVLWVNRRLAYVSGSSRVIDGASETYLAHEGVCRDFAHLTIAMLRAKGMPARLVSVYAPGLEPMDFHAVVEACLDGQWYVVDATGMAPRASLLRIATGRDAADTAFLTVTKGTVQLSGITVSAVVDPALPVEDTTRLVRLT
ncbi:MAG: transglutaminase-like domain-containing protein [Dermatophilaceae bacterium]